MKGLPSRAIFALAGGMGLLAFLYPFFLDQGQMAWVGGDAGITPTLTMILLLLCLLVLLLEAQGEATSAKEVAALGILVAVTATLRFIEVAIPGPGGFSPIFAPIILAGYVFGGRFGFLMGALTLLVSALVTGGVGPWLPYQMFAAGWAGLSAGWLPHPRRPGLAVMLLSGFGFFWGLLFGLLLNLSFWPFTLGSAPQSYQPGLGLGQALARYLAFYLATSLLWDLARAGGNALFLLVLGMPAVRALTRFRDRFHFRVVAPSPAPLERREAG